MREALRLRDQAVERGNAALLQHGDWHLDRCLFMRKTMHERAKPELISRANQEVMAAFDAYRHAIHGVGRVIGANLGQLLARREVHRSAPKSGRKIAM